MDIKPLPVKLIRQEPETSDSLRCCALMTLRYFDDKISKEKLWANLHSYKKHSGLSGTYYSDLGTFALKRKYKVLVSHSDWNWWNQWAQKASKKGKKAFIKTLEKLKAETGFTEKKLMQKKVNYVKKGGRYVFDLSGEEKIDSYLLKKLPVIITVHGKTFNKSPKADPLQAILIVGKVAGNYIIRDPMRAIGKIPAKELVYAWHRAGSWMMVIEPSEKKLKTKQNKLF